MGKSNLFVLGCGRSGTSLLAGLFRQSGYFMGDRLYQPRDSNPLGFFEDVEVNSINDSLVRPLLPVRLVHRGIGYAADVPATGQTWLSRIPLDVIPEATEKEQRRIQTLVNRAPFCFKDPRFSYTLHLWRREATNARFLCVFRDPREVVASILKEVRTVPYLANFAVSVAQIFELWCLMYRWILDRHSREGQWLFLSYDDLFRPNVLDHLEDFTGSPVDRSFPQPNLKRSVPLLPMDSAAQEIFQRLLQCRSENGSVRASH